MKLKRTKLAVAALTALMAVGAMSSFAYAEDAVDTPAVTSAYFGDIVGTVTYNNDIKYTAVGSTITTAQIEAGTVDCSVTYSVTGVDTSGNTKTVTIYTTGELSVTTAATCTETGKAVIKLTNTEDTSVVASADQTSAAITIAANGHTLVEQAGTTITAATCTSEGLQWVDRYCTVCEKIIDYEYTTQKIPATGHDYSTYLGLYATSATDTTGNIVIDTTATAITAYTYDDQGVVIGTVTLYPAVLSNGVVQLKETAKSGTYYQVYQCVKKDAYKAVANTKASSQGLSAKIVSSGSSNIAAIYVNNTRYTFANFVASSYNEFSATLKDLPDAETEVEMTDCESTGYYKVQLYDAEGNAVGGLITVDVDAHHLTTNVVVFDTKTDASMCTTTTQSDGTVKVVNNDCYNTASYRKVVVCQAAGCADCSTSCKKWSSDTHYSYWAATSSGALDTATYTYYIVDDTDATADPAGDHVYLTEARAAIESAANWWAEDFTYAKLLDVIEGKYNGVDIAIDKYGNVSAGVTTASDGTKYEWSKFVNVSSNPTTCTTDGTATITYTCIVDNVAIAYTQTVKVYAPGHSYEYVNETITTASCTSVGSYKVSHVCSVCGAVDPDVASYTVTIPRLAHTNELSDDGIYPKNGTTEGLSDDTSDANNQTIHFEFSGSKVIDNNSSLKAGTVLSYSSIDANGVVKDGDNGWLRIGNTSDDALALYVRAYTECTTCSDYKVYLTADVLKTGYLTVTVDAVQKQNDSGSGGYISLTASYTKYSGYSTKVVVDEYGTFAYYTSAEAYAARVEGNTTGVDPDEDVKNGLVLDSDGVYRYYLSDTFATTYTGVTSYNGGTFFIKNGLVDTTANGLCLYGGVWYYVSLGQVQKQYTGLVQYDGAWFYVTSGILDSSENGLVSYDGAKFLVADGQVLTSYNGLWQYSSTIGGDDNWYFIAAGQVADYSGVAMYDNAFFVVADGVLDTSYNGTIEYDGATFNVVAGQLYDQVA